MIPNLIRARLLRSYRKSRARLYLWALISNTRADSVTKAGFRN